MTNAPKNDPQPVPPSGSAPAHARWRRWHVISIVLLWALFFIHAGCWAHANHRSLFDPLIQCTDARIHLFPFHRYANPPRLAEDPLALDMLAFSTIGIRALYRLFVPWCGLFAAAKLVKALAYLIVAISMWILARSRRAGLAAAILLGFLMLRTDNIVENMAGGLQRAFGYPLMALWLAGALSRRPIARGASLLLASATYPTIMALLLGAEGLFRLWQGVRFRSPAFRRSLLRFAVLALCCYAVVSVDNAFLKPRRGRLPTVRETLADPAFQHGGRTEKVPFAPPWKTMRIYLATAFNPNSDSTYFHPPRWPRRLRQWGPFAWIVAAGLLPLWRRSPSPTAAFSILLASPILYGLARRFAFRLLYIPERYLQYGMTMFPLALAISSIGLLWPRDRHRARRATHRNLAATAFMAALLFWGGDGIQRDAGMRLNGRREWPLWEFLRTLPADSRIAGHPFDTESVPFWTALSITPGAEQLLPWLDESWKRNKALTERTLRALYATNRNEVLAFCRAEGITHLLLHDDRYGKKFVRNAQLFKPFDATLRELLNGRRKEELALANPPPAAVVFHWRDYRVVGTEKLAAIWTGESAAGPP